MKPEAACYAVAVSVLAHDTLLCCRPALSTPARSVLAILCNLVRDEPEAVAPMAVEAPAMKAVPAPVKA